MNPRRETASRATANGSARDGELLQATRRGDVARASQLLADGADVGTVGEGGLTPLHLAAKIGSCEIAELLLRHGARIDAVEENGWTALHVAAVKGQAGMVKLLLEHGAPVDARNKEGKTPAYVAVLGGKVFGGPAYAETIGVLRERGAAIPPVEEVDDFVGQVSREELTRDRGRIEANAKIRGSRIPGTSRVRVREFSGEYPVHGCVNDSCWVELVSGLSRDDVESQAKSVGMPLHKKSRDEWMLGADTEVYFTNGRVTGFEVPLPAENPKSP